MILYKYVSLCAARDILETSALGFSQPEFFNDPFDLPTYPPENEQGPEGMFSSIRRLAKQNVWKEKTGILALTRTPTNPLMWAHYANSHKGAVIGIDAATAALTDERSNLIPAQYGNVVYVSKRPPDPLIGRPGSGIEVGGTHHFDPGHYEKLQRLFLHKPICWSYEEEVRVVKCLKGITPENGSTPSGDFKIVPFGGRPLFTFKIPREAIQEVYLGFRSDHHASDELREMMRGEYADAAVYECTLDNSALSVGFQKYVPMAEGAE